MYIQFIIIYKYTGLRPRSARPQPLVPTNLQIIFFFFAVNKNYKHCTPASAPNSSASSYYNHLDLPPPSSTLYLT